MGKTAIEYAREPIVKENLRRWVAYRRGNSAEPPQPLGRGLPGAALVSTPGQGQVQLEALDAQLLFELRDPRVRTTAQHSTALQCTVKSVDSRLPRACAYVIRNVSRCHYAPRKHFQHRRHVLQRRR